MDREELFKKADEMRASPPSYFKFDGLHDLDDMTVLKEYYLDLGFQDKVHFYLILPKGAEGSKLPFIVNMHGGGMVRDHSDRDILLCRRLAMNGMAVVSVDYHLAPQYVYPYALDEIYALIRYLNDNNDGYGLVKGRYILCGQSSGGNLALVTSMRLKDTPYKPLGQVLCYSVLDQKTDPDDKPDLCDDERKELYRFYFQCYIGDAAPETPEISPLFYEVADFKELPETIMIEGGLNELKSENISLFKKLCDSGVKAQMAFYPDSPHGFLVNQKAEWKEAQEHIFNEAKRIFTL